MTKRKGSVECNLCGGDIFLEVDDYVVLTDYHNGDFYMEGYYHNSCWHEKAHKETLNKIKSKSLSLLKKRINKNEIN